LFDDGIDILAARLRVFPDFKVFGVDVILLGEAHRGRKGDPVFVEGLVGRRTLDQVLAVRLIRGERVDRDNEPPGGREDADVAVFQSKFIQE
jgi:hypothetical protein